MKHPISFSLTIIIICVLMNATPGISYHYLIGVDRDLVEFTKCSIWIEDVNHNVISGVRTNNSNCDGGYFAYYVDSDIQYWVIADVTLSFEQDKLRGPYQKQDTCFLIHGSVDKWRFDEIGCGGGVPQ